MWCQPQERVRQSQDGKHALEPEPRGRDHFVIPNITGDANCDHPPCRVAILGLVLEAKPTVSVSQCTGDVRQVLDCASPLALWKTAAKSKAR